MSFSRVALVTNPTALNALARGESANVFALDSKEVALFDDRDPDTDAHQEGCHLSLKGTPVVVSDETYAEADIYVNGVRVQSYRCPNT